MEWAKQQLQPGPPGGEPAGAKQRFNSLVLYTATLFGFFFLCRAGEYLRSGVADGRELRGMDVRLSQEQCGHRADKQFRKTKADQNACARALSTRWRSRKRKRCAWWRHYYGFVSGLRRGSWVAAKRASHSSAGKAASRSSGGMCRCFSSVQRMQWAYRRKGSNPTR